MFFSSVCLVLVFFLPILQAVCCCIACMMCGMRGSRSGVGGAGLQADRLVKWRMFHLLQLLTEWACLDVTVLALLAFGPDIGKLGGRLGRSTGRNHFGSVSPNVNSAGVQGF